MTGTWLLFGGTFLLTASPAIQTFLNLLLFRPPPAAVPAELAISVIVPARNEERDIGACLDSICASRHCALEVIVVDDHSTDATAAIVAAQAARDARVRRIVPPPLPADWSGKPHACWAGAQAATHPVLLFLDADVRVSPDAVARLAAGLRGERLALASAFPRERTETLGEALLVPLIHVLLLGYLPFRRMRDSAAPAYAAGCGQIMMADVTAYRAIGGHGAVRASWHDGVTLPRAFRARGRMTGLFDATHLAECRMYRGWHDAWRGFSKNAREGLAKPVALPVWTLLLGGAFVAVPLLAFLWPLLWVPVALLAAARVAVGVRFRQSPVAVLLTPLAMATMLVLQWRALLRGRGKSIVWRGRVQAT